MPSSVSDSFGPDVLKLYVPEPVKTQDSNEVVLIQQSASSPIKVLTVASVIVALAMALFALYVSIAFLATLPFKAKLCIGITTLTLLLASIIGLVIKNLPKKEGPTALLKLGSFAICEDADTFRIGLYWSLRSLIEEQRSPFSIFIAQCWNHCTSYGVCFFIYWRAPQKGPQRAFDQSY